MKQLDGHICNFDDVVASTHDVQAVIRDVIDANSWLASIQQTNLTNG